MTSTVLHLGLGAFHRAHQLAYMQDLHDTGDTRWAYVSGNIRPDALDPALILRSQQCAYTLETVSPAGERAWRRITALRDALPWTPDLRELLAVGAAASTRIVSFTVTEAGYQLDSEGRLDTAAGEVQKAVADAQAGRAGGSIYSVLAAILRLRMRLHRDAAPLTLLCCDNLRHNGRRVQRAFADFLALAGDDDLAAWTAANTSFPNTMVDRITPVATSALQERVRAATGRQDLAAVGAESYIQWVLEDDFRNGRPAWENVGAQLVRAVEPYEEAKIRVLNASHSAIAWAGSLAGYRFIDEALRDTRIRALAHAWITDAVFDCLRPSPIDLEAYRDSILERFASVSNRDTVERVLADSFSKLPGFVVPTILERIRRSLPLDSAAVLPALFLQVLLRWHAGRLDVRYRDQAYDAAVAGPICSAGDPVAVFCDQPLLWGELAGDARLEQAVRAATDAATAMAKDASGRSSAQSST
jgi:D-arabinitol 4-dehydrogenase